MIRSISKLKNKGFTIVELLVVIVVIGILAAITIVSYTGITTKAKSSAAAANATSVQAAADAYAADPAKTGYPTSMSGLKTSTYAKLPAGITIQSGNPAATDPETVIGYKIISLTEASNTGACISYYDYSDKVLKTLFSGTATTLASCSITPSA